MLFVPLQLSCFVSRRAGGLEMFPAAVNELNPVSRRAGGLEIMGYAAGVSDWVSRRAGGLENCNGKSVTAV